VQEAPTGRLRHWTVALVVLEGKVTLYVAVLPGEMAAVVFEKDGALLVDCVESTSNASELEVPPPGVGVRIVIDVEPVDAMSLAGTFVVSWVALT